jgi:hypothetical protein
VSIGLISFAAVAQLAPAFIGALYWRGGSRAGAYSGLSVGALVWAWTLLVPSAAHSGWLPGGWLDAGPFGLALLRPQALFGLDDLSPIAHGVFWSLSLNALAYVLVSLSTTQDAQESAQAARFVDVMRRGDAAQLPLWRGGVALPELQDLLARMLGRARAEGVLARAARSTPMIRACCSTSRPRSPARSAVPRRASWSSRSRASRRWASRT